MTTYRSYDREHQWEGQFEIFRTEPVCEARVEAHGSSFDIILGKHRYGHFLCIPGWDMGTGLARLEDRFWNREQLCRIGLSDIDACSLADAIREIGEYLAF